MHQNLLFIKIRISTIRIFLVLLFLSFVYSVSFSQSSTVSQGIAVGQSEKDRWNIDANIWSHAHYITGKNDKPAMDFNAIGNWPVLSGDVLISPNGRYFSYAIDKGSEWNYKRRDSLIIQSIEGSWRKSFSKANTGFFSADSKQYMFLQNGTFYFIPLGGRETDSVTEVESYKVSANKEWIAIAINHLGIKSVRLQNLRTKKEKEFSEVMNFTFNNSGQWFYYESYEEHSPLKWLYLYNLNSGQEKSFLFDNYLFDEKGQFLVRKETSAFTVDHQKETLLEYINLQNNSKNTIWSSTDPTIKINSYNLDKSGKQVVMNLSKNGQNSIWYWKEGMDTAILKINEQTKGITDDLIIQPSVSFTDNGRYIQFSLQPKPELLKKVKDAVQLDVWSYDDSMLQSVQTYLSKRVADYKGIFNLDNSQVIQLEKGYEKLDQLKGDFALIKKSNKEVLGDRFWKKDYDKDSNWVISLKDGSRRLLLTRGEEYTLFFSPGGKHLVYFDAEKGCHYFSYNLETRELRDISAGVPEGQFGYKNRYWRSRQKPNQSCGIAGWIEGDGGLLVYDNYDIWQLELSGDELPKNLTNSYGALHRIAFSLIKAPRYNPGGPTLEKDETLLLNAFDQENKYNGFYESAISKVCNPQLLFMGSYFTNRVSGSHDPNLSDKGMKPIKASDVNVWIVQRQSVADAPNYYETKDFKSFKKMTNYQPQKQYNWLTEELHNFKHLDSSNGQGILYKPENFDPSKKYPVIVIFYGGYSNNLYQSPTPSYINTAIAAGSSPILLLNAGYLVFTPDIYVSPGKYGPEALNVIEGAVNYLKKLPYVDSNKLGCCAHSWSAKLGSYLFTHSTSFNAMAISEGLIYADMINVAFSNDENGKSNLADIENGEYQFGALWDNKKAWLDQTTVINVNKAKSPLLLLCNKESSEEYQNQTLQFFTALRRLEKKVWWLKYDKGSHVLTDLDEQKDYTVRYIQFFDHYLKQAPAPRWMTQGIPNKLKGIEARYELDAAGSCAMQGKNHCYVCEAWNKQYKRTPAMFEKEIKYWELDKDLKEELDRKTKAERAKLDKEQLLEDKKIVNILKYGYPEDKRSQKK